MLQSGRKTPDINLAATIFATVTKLKPIQRDFRITRITLGNDQGVAIKPTGRKPAGNRPRGGKKD